MRDARQMLDGWMIAGEEEVGRWIDSGRKPGLICGLPHLQFQSEEPQASAPSRGQDSLTEQEQTNSVAGPGAWVHREGMGRGTTLEAAEFLPGVLQTEAGPATGRLRTGVGPGEEGLGPAQQRHLGSRLGRRSWLGSPGLCSQLVGLSEKVTALSQIVVGP